MRPLLVLILGITFLPLFLGGGVVPLTYGMTLFLMGVTVAVFPPKNSLGLTLNIGFLTVVVMALTAFLPARFLSLPAWRNAAATDVGINLAGFLSPQPWVSLHHLVIGIALLLWIYTLCVRKWTEEDQLYLLRGAGFILICFAALALACKWLDWLPPFWDPQMGFGPFPNRNQTGTVLAMGGVAVVVCAQADFQHHKLRTLLWVLGLGVIGIALIMNASRGGIVALFGGLAAWVGFSAWLRRSVTRLGVAGSLVIVGAAAFFLFGGEALDRFKEINEPGDTGISLKDEDTNRGRVAIYWATTKMIRDMPVFGCGLGNFEAVFPFYRSSLDRWERAVHPESDWFWLTSELGIAGLLSVCILAAMLGRRILTFSRNKRRESSQVRAGALAAVAAFAVHSFFDVPAHRLGSFLPALLFLGIAIHHRRGRRPRAPKIRWTFRIAGTALAIASAAWVLTATGLVSLPGAIGAEARYDDAVVENDANHVAVAHDLVSRAIPYRPMQWNYYFLRGITGARGATSFRDARTDFRIARFLEPNYSMVPLEEAMFWNSIYPPYALPALREAFHRSNYRTGEYYRRITGKHRDDPVMLEGLARISDGFPEMKIDYLTAAGKTGFGPELERILAVDPELARFSVTQKQRLFALWTKWGNAEELVAELANRTEWRKAGWRILAMTLADKGDYRSACAVAMESAPPPTIPKLYPAASLESLRARFYAELENPDPGLGLQLYYLELDYGHEEEALIILERVATMKGTPDYVFYLLATISREDEDFEKAWMQLDAYLERITK